MHDKVELLLIWAYGEGGTHAAYMFISLMCECTECRLNYTVQAPCNKSTLREGILHTQTLQH